MAEITNEDEADVEILKDSEAVEAAIVDGTYDSPDMWDNAERKGSDEDDDDSDPADKMAEKAAERVLSKEWVKDPSPTADTMRWRNTDTGEYRYQPNKPGSGEGGDSDETDDESGGSDAEGGSTEPESSVVEIADGVYAEVEVGEVELGRGDWIMVNGEQYQVETVGTDELGNHRIQIATDGTVPTVVEPEQVDGKVTGQKYEVGDYDVDGIWGAKFAHGINSGVWAEQGEDGFVGVRDIQHHASDIENTDLLADMAETEMHSRDNEHAKQAIRGRIRALGGDPAELIETPEPDGDRYYDPSEYSDWSEAYSPSNAADTVNLAAKVKEGEVEAGVSERQMYIDTMDDGTRAFRTMYADHANGSGMDTRYRDEIVCLGHFARKAGVEGSVVPVAHDEENGEWTSVKEFGDGVEAQEVKNTPDEWKAKVDAEDAIDLFATMCVGGALDLHGSNVMVNERGELGFHDLDHADSEIWDGSDDSFSVARCASETLGRILRHHDYGDVPEEIQDRVTEDEWENESVFGIKKDIQAAISARMKDRALEIFKDNPNLDDLFYEPDTGYHNLQGAKNETIRDNIIELAKNHPEYTQ